MILGFSVMYSHVFNFRFAETILPAERMRILSELFDLPLSSDIRRTIFTGIVPIIKGLSSVIPIAQNSQNWLSNGFVRKKTRMFCDNPNQDSRAAWCF